MKIKLDENLSRHLKDALSQLGHDVSTAVEEGLLGKVDSEMEAAAKGEDRMIFTPGSRFCRSTKVCAWITSRSRLV